jgi:hypothetical protein
VALTPILYFLLRPVSKFLAMMMVLFNLMCVALEGGATLYLMLALFPVGRMEWLASFDPQQLATLAMLSIRSHTYGFGVDLIFFGFTCLLMGYLIVRSGYFPRALGVLMQLAGVCYLINSFALILSPALSSRLFPLILMPCLVGEAAFGLWLLVKGVDVVKWEQADHRARVRAAMVS